MLRFGLSIFAPFAWFAVITLLLVISASAQSQPTQPTELPSPKEDNSIGSPQMIQWLTELIHDNLPESYEDNRKWNLQREVFKSVHIELDGMNLKTHRNRKLVNAGTWTRYEIRFIEPDKNLQIQFNRLEPGQSAQIIFETTVTTPLEIHGQLAEWARDVKLFSISAQATAKVKLNLSGTVQFKLNMLKIPPDVAIKPNVDQAQVELLQYNVERISRIGGDAAELLGKGMRRAIDERIKEFNETLVAKINRQLEKQQDKMSFSTNDWIVSKLPLPMAPKKP